MLIWVKLYIYFFFRNSTCVKQLGFKSSATVLLDVIWVQAVANTVKSRKFKVLGTLQSVVTEEMSTLNSTCCSNVNDSINEIQLKSKDVLDFLSLAPPKRLKPSRRSPPMNGINCPNMNVF